MPADLELIRRILRRTSFGSSTGCWICNYSPKSSCGYANMRISGKYVRCHRAMYKLTKGLIPNGILVMHTCDNPRCVNPKHLMLGTNSDNMRDGALKNRFVHKLNLPQVGEIRRLTAMGLRQVDIAKMFGLNQGTVSKISNLKRRQHV